MPNWACGTPGELAWRLCCWVLLLGHHQQSCWVLLLGYHQHCSTLNITKQSQAVPQATTKACQATATCPQRLGSNMHDELLQHG
jgi:hypothetical protein